MQRPQIRIVNKQTETVNDDRELSEDEKKLFFYNNYPDLYKKLYPDQVIDKKEDISNIDIDKSISTGDIGKTNKTYVYDRYSNSNIEGNDLNFNIKITTDMKLNK